MLFPTYMHIINNALTEEELQEIERVASEINFTEGRTGSAVRDPDRPDDGNINPEIRTSQVKWIETFPYEIEMKLGSLMTQTLDETGWRFDIEGHQAFQYTVYNANPNAKGDFYTWHTDSHDSTYPDGTIRKLSFTLQLSDPDEYEGGLFQWLEPWRIFDRFTEDNYTNVDFTNAIRSIPFSAKSRGSILFFPSYIHHQVTPVTRGTRKSLVGWCYGQPYV